MPLSGVNAAKKGGRQISTKNLPTALVREAGLEPARP